MCAFRSWGPGWAMSAWSPSHWSLPLNHAWGHQGKAGNVSSKSTIKLGPRLDCRNFRGFWNLCIFLLWKPFGWVTKLLWDHFLCLPFHMNLNMSSNRILPISLEVQCSLTLFTLSHQSSKKIMFVICASSKGACCIIPVFSVLVGFRCTWHPNPTFTYFYVFKFLQSK